MVYTWQIPAGEPPPPLDPRAWHVSTIYIIVETMFKYVGIVVNWISE